jgi:hypothetical protein
MEKSIVIAGLPSSGKTTFLAALWHLLTAVEQLDNICYTLGPVQDGEYTHLNILVECWRAAKTQERTGTVKHEVVKFILLDGAQRSSTLTFPDLSGESYRDMWADRNCSKSLYSILAEGDGLLLFIHADKIDIAQLTVDVAQDQKDAGVPLIPVPAGTEKTFAAKNSPTQVALTDILQLFKAKPLSVTMNKLAIVLSAWDKVEDENLTPEDFLSERFPLLNQYLKCGADNWEWKVFGISAQGADYYPDSKSEEQLSPEQVARIQELYELDSAFKRIKVVCDDVSQDLTRPIEWLLK